jgi:4-hydroxy-tetrahydrodipicolinate synthase
MSADIAMRLHGVHAATIVPMTADFRLDEEALEGHLHHVSHAPGIRGLLVNGHAGENFVLTPAEKRRVIEIARRTVPRGCLICSGINAESSLAAAADAAAAEAAGADILLLFPPNSFALPHDPEAVMAHHRYVLASNGLPMLLYGASVNAGHMAYRHATLARLVEEPRILGIKEGSWEIAAYEANHRLLTALRPDLVVLGSGDEHLLASCMVGSDGMQVSLAAVFPGLVTDLWTAAVGKDWDAARIAHERIYPLAAAIYRDGHGGRATARLKACLALLGRLTSTAVRPPQPPASDGETEALRSAIAGARLNLAERISP